jgi:hypothetical protein
MELKRASNTAWVPANHEGVCHGSPAEKDTGWCNDDAHWKVFKSEKWRANWIPAPHYYNLNQACVILNKAFGDFGCYLVGSSLKRKDFRDVDVRYILEDSTYDRLFGAPGGWTNALWSLMCTTISAWLSQQTGLPVDFQIQRMTQANEDHSRKDGHDRSPLGIFVDYPGERPTDLKTGRGDPEAAP